MSKKSAKDLAFDKERDKYRREIRELKYELKQSHEASAIYIEDLQKANEKIEELQDWINRLLEYTEMSEEDMKKLIQKEKDTAEVMEHMNVIMGIGRKLGGAYL